MSAVPTSVKILEKEYVISCPEGEQQALIDSADFLTERMLEAREGGKIIGTERIAVIAALNVIHDYLRLVRESEARESALNTGVARLEEKIRSTLSRAVDETPSSS